MSTSVFGKATSRWFRPQRGAWQKPGRWSPSVREMVGVWTVSQIQRPSARRGASSRLLRRAVPRRRSLKTPIRSLHLKRWPLMTRRRPWERAIWRGGLDWTQGRLTEASHVLRMSRAGRWGQPGLRQYLGQASRRNWTCLMDRQGGMIPPGRTTSWMGRVGSRSEMTDGVCVGQSLDLQQWEWEDKKAEFHPHLVPGDSRRKFRTLLFPPPAHLTWNCRWNKQPRQYDQQGVACLTVQADDEASDVIITLCEMMGIIH